MMYIWVGYLDVLTQPTLLSRVILSMSTGHTRIVVYSEKKNHKYVFLFSCLIPIISVFIASFTHFPAFVSLIFPEFNKTGLGHMFLLHDSTTYLMIIQSMFLCHLHYTASTVAFIFWIQGDLIWWLRETGAQEIDLTDQSEQDLPLDHSLGLQLPQIHHLRSTRIWRSDAAVLTVLLPQISDHE